MTYSLKTLDSRSGGNGSGRQPVTLLRVLQELLLLVGGVALLFVVMALLTYSPTDAAWSTSGTGEAVRNSAGKLGALVADCAYVLLGYSVWWAVLAAAVVWLKGMARWWRGVAPAPVGLRRRLVFWPGLVLLLAASSGLEWSRLPQWDDFLPGKAGGALGALGGLLATQWLGETVSALLGVIAVMAGAALAFDFSWASVADRVGALVYLGGACVGRQLARVQDGYMGWRAARQRDSARAAAPRTEFPPPEIADPPAPEAAPAARPQARAALRDEVIDVPHAFVTEAPRQPVEPVLRPHAPAASDFSAQPAPAASRARVFINEEDALDGVHPAAEAASPAVGPGDAPEPVWGAAPPWEDAAEPTLAPPAAARAAPAADFASERVARARQKNLFADLPESVLPPVGLLDAAPEQSAHMNHADLEMTSRLIEKKLKDFGVQVQVVDAAPGPVITRYEIEPATGVKGAQIVNLAKDLARSLSLTSIRVVETIPGKNCMALELPNARRQTIRLSEILGSPTYLEAKSLLTVGLGKDIVGKPVVADLAKMPHVLVAGTTGSGKSVGINAMILSLLYKAEPKDVRLLMIDPKMLEMSVYEGIPHLLCPVVTDMKQAAHGLNWCVAEMERRYKLMSKAGVRNLAGFNKKIDEARERGELIPNPFSLTPEDPEPLERLPYIVVVIDELADLMMVVGKKIEELIARLAQKARAAGIHLILATQRPSVDVITGLIKANIPTRIAFQVSSKIDSRTILDHMGAETLLGMGDMLYQPAGTGLPVRAHGAFVSDDEVHCVVEFLKKQGEPNYIEGVLEGGTVDGDDGGNAAFSGEGFAGGGGEQDPLYDRAVEFVLTQRKATISALQRALKIGYGRSARLLDQMEAAGVVSAMDERNSRSILVPPRD